MKPTEIQAGEKRTRENEDSIESHLIAKISACCREYEKLLCSSKKEEDKKRNIYAIQLSKDDIKQFHEGRLKPLKKQIEQHFRKSDMITLADLLQFPLLPLLMSAKHYSTTVKVPKNLDVEGLTITLWDNFIPEVKTTLSKLKEKNIVDLSYYASSSTVGSEKTLGFVWKDAVEKFVNIFVKKGKFISCLENEEVVGEPDFIYMEQGHVKTVGELKTWWDFPFDNLVLECQKKNPNNKVWTAVLQLYGYMTYNQLRYGFLTNYVHTWFFCRIDTNGGKSALKISPPIKYDGTTNQITVFAAFYHFVTKCLAKNKFRFTSQTSSPYLPVPRSYISLEEFEKGDLQFILPQHVSFKKYLGYGAYGRVFEGMFAERPCVLKTIDVSKNDELKEKVANEVSTMKKLQSTGVIPKLYGFASLNDMLYIIAMQQAEELDLENEDISELREGVTRLYSCIHDNNIIHNDIEWRHVMRIGGKLALIDFSHSTESTDQQLKQVEMENVNELFDDIE